MKQETVGRDTELKRNKDTEQLREQVAELKAKLKEKNETLAKLQNTHTNDTSEMAELKYKLGAQNKAVSDVQEELRHVKEKMEEVQAKYVEAENKASKLAKKLVMFLFKKQCLIVNRRSKRKRR